MTEEIMQTQFVERQDSNSNLGDYYADVFEDELFHPTPVTRTTVKIKLKQSCLMSIVGERLLAEMNRVYKGFGAELTITGDEKLTSTHISNYLLALIKIRAMRANGEKLENELVVNFKRIQVPSFIYPLLKKLGPVNDVKRGLRIEPDASELIIGLTRDQINNISEVFFGLREYNFSSEAGIPQDSGSLDLMGTFVTSDFIQGSEVLSPVAMVFSYKESHPVVGFYSALLGSTLSDDVTKLFPTNSSIKYGNLSDYVGSIPRILRPRQK